MDIFEEAIRRKVRFDYRGVCSCEDLYDLTPEEGDEIYKSLSKELKEIQGESLLEENKKNDLLELKINIVKHIVKTKIQEKKIQEDLAARKDRKQRLLAIRAQKQDEEFFKKDLGELDQIINEL